MHLVICTLSAVINNKKKNEIRYKKREKLIKTIITIEERNKSLLILKTFINQSSREKIMPYISAAQVAEVRKELKATFPTFKFSVTKRDDMVLCVAILHAPINLLEVDTQGKYEPINYFHCKEIYAHNPVKLEILTRILSIMRKNNRIISEDADYGSIPNYYINLSIGVWNKPFEVTTNEGKL